MGFGDSNLGRTGWLGIDKVVVFCSVCAFGQKLNVFYDIRSASNKIIAGTLNTFSRVGF